MSASSPTCWPCSIEVYGAYGSIATLRTPGCSVSSAWAALALPLGSVVDPLLLLDPQPAATAATTATTHATRRLFRNITTSFRRIRVRRSLIYLLSEVNPQ